MEKPDFRMTVGELRRVLANFDEDTPVAMTYDYGDHCHHMVALSPDLDPVLYPAKWSEYCLNNVLSDPDESWHDPEECEDVLVLNGRWL